MAGGFENGEEVKVVSKSGVNNLMDLYSDQEEADTRLVLHVQMYWFCLFIIPAKECLDPQQCSCTLDMAKGRGLSQSVQLQISLVQHFLHVCLHATPSQVVIPQAACTKLGRLLRLPDSRPI